MNLLKISWRNLWRNKRRTAITSASILFAVFFAVIMRAYQLGFYDHMIKNAVESYSGYLQIQQKNFQYDPSLDNTFQVNDSFIDSIKHVKDVDAVVPRVQTAAFASSGVKTKLTLIMGVDPIKEKSLSNPEKNLIRYRITEESLQKLKSNDKIPVEVKNKLKDILHNSYANTGSIAMDLGLDKDKSVLDVIAKASTFPGSYLTPGDKGILVSEKLAKYLKLDVGDTLILYGMGYHGVTAAGLFPVQGLISMPNPELDNKLIFADITTVQQFASLGDNLTSVSINLKNTSEKELKEKQKEITQLIDNKNLTVRNWKDFNKVLSQQIESDNNSGKIFLGLLYFIIFFGIFGTVLMMIHERYREFGVLVSIGMQKRKLAIIIVYEMIFMGTIGVIVGSVISLPIILYFYYNPIQLTGDMAQVMVNMGFEPVMPLAFPDTYMLWQSLIVALMVVFSCTYPLRKIFRLKEIQALRA